MPCNIDYSPRPIIIPQSLFYIYNCSPPKCPKCSSLSSLPQIVPTTKNHGGNKSNSQKNQSIWTLVLWFSPSLLLLLASSTNNIYIYMW